ncbi:LysR family transcriptional regulator [Nocardiopsis sp. CNT312]|uniref:LysR family transcriptional regulator n=1 Tax=Nocardiopsis sp. CNT312 TaxID=1137268 RepID=UPI00048AFF23|nr:LysR family transcriptional regulator [Nocardiopsis sp. CNT312]
MTPTQLRAYSAVARLGSVKRAARELDVSEAAVSLHIGKLRKTFDDRLFVPTAAGLSFTPGGLRLAVRAIELLGLQDRTLREVSQARHRSRLLRVATSSVFAEYAAPGLLDLFVSRADDLDVELSVHNTGRFDELLRERAVDVAIGPEREFDAGLSGQTILNYEVLTVVGRSHPLAGNRTDLARLREQTWLLGPSAMDRIGLVPSVLRRLEIPEGRQRLFQSHAAALEEVKKGRGVGLAPGFSVAADLASGALVTPKGPPVRTKGSWSAVRDGCHDPSGVVAEFLRFATTPRATQAMLHGSGVHRGRFRPAVHVTLWNQAN